MKQILNMAICVLLAFSVKVQACWAEFGEQATIPGLKAGNDMSALQYRAVRASAAGVTMMCSETAVTSLGAQQYIGILQNKPKTDEAATVAYAGLSKAVTGAAVTVNMPVTHNASGQVINAVSGAVVIGRALEATGAAGEVATVLLLPPTRWGAIL